MPDRRRSARAEIYQADQQKRLDAAKVQADPDNLKSVADAWHFVRALGLNQQDISEALQFLLTGFKITEYREGIELIDVVARAPAAERLNTAARFPLVQSTKTRFGSAGTS